MRHARGGRAPDIREIHGEADLASDAGTGDVLPSQHSEVEGHAVSKLNLAADHRLELAPGQVGIGTVSTEEFSPEREPGGEVVENRHATGNHVATRGGD